MNKTFSDLKEEIARVKTIEVEGFDNDWVLSRFGRDQALINVKKIKPYTDQYAMIVRYLVTGYCDASAFAAADAVFDAANAAGTAWATALAAGADDYTHAIECLTTLADEYLALLDER